MKISSFDEISQSRLERSTVCKRKSNYVGDYHLPKATKLSWATDPSWLFLALISSSCEYPFQINLLRPSWLLILSTNFDRKLKLRPASLPENYDVERFEMAFWTKKILLTELSGSRFMPFYACPSESEKLLWSKAWNEFLWFARNFNLKGRSGKREIKRIKVGLRRKQLFKFALLSCISKLSFNWR